jgi:hypothetical protein
MARLGIGLQHRSLEASVGSRIIHHGEPCALREIKIEVGCPRLTGNRRF